MKRTFELGKIAYTSSGKRHPVTVTMSYEDGRFAASGEIWNQSRTDCYQAGQCLDTIAEYIKTPLFSAIHRLWKLYHLNNMHPECEHQRELGWDELAKRETAMHTFKLKTEVFTERRKIEGAALSALRKTGSAEISSAEQTLLNLPLTVITHLPEMAPEHSPFYKHESSVVKLLGHLRPSEHPAGILGKECPVCGYGYGTAWRTFPIPPADEELIIKLINTGEL